MSRHHYGGRKMKSHSWSLSARTCIVLLIFAFMFSPCYPTLGFAAEETVAGTGPAGEAGAGAGAAAAGTGAAEGLTAAVAIGAAVIAAAAVALIANAVSDDDEAPAAHHGTSAHH
jgi:hypothetical protein